MKRYSSSHNNNNNSNNNNNTYYMLDKIKRIEWLMVASFVWNALLPYTSINIILNGGGKWRFNLLKRMPVNNIF